jgi:hypothetical protein
MLQLRLVLLPEVIRHLLRWMQTIVDLFGDGGRQT